jgi:sugar phosphate isomerase/epimerase
MTPARRFPLGVQLTLPEHYQNDGDFSHVLSLSRKSGLTELELNILEPDEVDFSELESFLKSFGLPMTRVATGGFAKRHELSLSSGKEEVRGESVACCASLVRTARLHSWEVIIGIMKGAQDGDPPGARERFRRSLFEIADLCAPGLLPVLLEATNRYESPIANTLDDAASLVSAYAGRGMKILPDSFHMNIEESNTASALTRFRGRYSSIHISDNNRLLPGFGAIDFAELFHLLSAIGYTGSLVFEGSPRRSLYEDLEYSIAYVDRVLEGHDKGLDGNVISKSARAGR